MKLKLPEVLLLAFLPFALLACDDGPTAPTMGDASPDPDSPAAPNACVTTDPDPAVIGVGEAITLNASCSEGGSELVRFDWELGDGRTRSGMVIQPSYAEAGVYQVRLTVSDALERQDTTSVEVQVGDAGENLQACMEWTQVPLTNEELAPCGFRFDASCSTGNIAEYRWFFQGNPRSPDFDDVTMTTTEPQVTYTWREDIECSAFRPFERIVRLTVVGESGETDTVEEVLRVEEPLKAP